MVLRNFCRIGFALVALFQTALVSAPTMAQNFRPYDEAFFVPFNRGDFVEALEKIAPFVAACEGAAQCAHLLAFQSKILENSGAFEESLRSADKALGFAEQSGDVDLRLQAHAAKAAALFSLNRLSQTRAEFDKAAAIAPKQVAGRGAIETYFVLLALTSLTKDVDSAMGEARNLGQSLENGDCDPAAIDLCVELWGVEPAAYALSDGPAKELEIIERNLGFLERHIGRDSLEYGSLLADRASSFENEGRIAEAERDYLKSMAIIESRVGSEHPEYADVLASYGDLLTADSRRHGEAATLLVQSIMAMRKHYGDTHILTMIDYVGAADTMLALGAHEEAATLSFAAYLGTVELVGDDWIAPAYALTIYSLAVLRSEKIDEAEQAARQAEELFIGMFGEETYFRHILASLRGGIAMMDDRYAEAADIMLPAYLALERGQSVADPQLQSLSSLLATAYEEMPGHLPEARHWNGVAVEKLLRTAERSGAGQESNNETLADNADLFLQRVRLSWQLSAAVH